MKRNYHCSICSALLNPGAKIVLRATRGTSAGLFLFSSTPGNYEVTIPEGFELARGQEITFGCPVCGADLTSRQRPDMTELRFAGPGTSTGTVAFSRTFGQHETYFITEDDVRRFGEHANDVAMNFWGSGPED